MLVSFVHSIRMCFIVYWFPHEHLGGGLSFRMTEGVNLVCPILIRIVHCVSKIGMIPQYIQLYGFK